MKLPEHIKLCEETYINSKHKAKFVDLEFGEFWEYPFRVKNGKQHPQRAKLIRIKKSLENVKQKLPDFISIEESSFTSTHSKAKFIDKEFGEWFARPDHVVAGARHPRRANPRILTAKQIQNRLPNYLKIDETTFTKMTAECRFIDAEYGEFWRKPTEVLRGRNQLRKKIRTLSESNIKSRLPKYIKLDFSTFVNTSIKARFIDDKFGEFWAKPTHVLRGSVHPERALAESRIPVEDIIKLLPPHVRLDLETYSGNKYPARFIDEEKGDCWLTPYYILKHGYKHPKDAQTRLEKKFSELLNVTFFNRCVTKQYRPDFKITDSVFVNVDGLYWHSEKEVKRSYHLEMRKTFESLGFRLLQFHENEVYEKSEIVKSIVKVVAGAVEHKIFARKCIIKEVDSKISTEFLKNNHLMGSIKSRKSVGLYYNNELVALLAYSIHEGGKKLKIDRFCLKLNCSVVGGLSKLLNYIVKNNRTLKYIESWVDLRYGNGHSLEKLGFKKIKETLGWKWTDYKTTFNRLKCRANMDSRQLSEKEYAQELGWVKIYDAGQALFRKSL